MIELKKGDEKKFCKEIFKDDIDNILVWGAVILICFASAGIAIGTAIYLPKTVGTYMVDDTWCDKHIDSYNQQDGCDDVDYWFVGIVPSGIFILILYGMIKLYNRWVVPQRVCEAFTKKKLEEEAEEAKKQLEKMKDESEDK